MSLFISQWVGQSITSQTSLFPVSIYERSWNLLYGSSHYHKKNPNKKPSISPQKTPYNINKYTGLPTHKPLRTPHADDHGPYMKSHCFQNCNVIPDVCLSNIHILVTNCIYPNVILGNLSKYFKKSRISTIRRHKVIKTCHSPKNCFCNKTARK